MVNYNGDRQRIDARVCCALKTFPDTGSKGMAEAKLSLANWGARQHPGKSFFGSVQLPCCRAQQIPYNLTSSSSDLLIGVTKIRSFNLHAGRVCQHGQIHIVKMASSFRLILGLCALGLYFSNYTLQFVIFDRLG